MVWASAFVGSFSFAFEGYLALLVSCVEPEEQGKVIAGNAMMTGVSIMVGDKFKVLSLHNICCEDCFTNNVLQ